MSRKSRAPTTAEPSAGPGCQAQIDLLSSIGYFPATRTDIGEQHALHRHPSLGSFH
jgi:hypothetical protein